MLEVSILADGSTTIRDLGDSSKDRTFADLADLIVKTVDMRKYVNHEQLKDEKPTHKKA